MLMYVAELNVGLHDDRILCPPYAEGTAILPEYDRRDVNKLLLLGPSCVEPTSFQIYRQDQLRSRPSDEKHSVICLICTKAF